jgi:hypothetical protein
VSEVENKRKEREVTEEEIKKLFEREEDVMNNQDEESFCVAE